MKMRAEGTCLFLACFVITSCVGNERQQRTSHTKKTPALPAGMSELQSRLFRSRSRDTSSMYPFQISTKADCYVEVREPRRIGGRCGRVRGGTPYCLARGFLYLNHPHCMGRP